MRVFEEWSEKMKNFDETIWLRESREENILIQNDIEIIILLRIRFSKYNYFQWLEWLNKWKKKTNLIRWF